MNIQEIMELMKLFDSLQMERFEWEGDFGRLVLEKPETKPFVSEPQFVAQSLAQSAQPAQKTAPVLQATPTDEPDSNARYVTAPLVGIFYSQASPGQSPFVQVGDQVRQGQTLCIIEAMKMMNEITSDIDGEIVEIHGENGQMVEYGQNLFTIREV